MQDALSTINRREIPQSEQARPDQVQNSAGGYVFQTDDWSRALRFLILGTDGGTYYVSERDLTRESASLIEGLARTHGVKLVELIRDVSIAGRAPRQNPTLFALAACTASPDVETRQAAMRAIPDVCRTGTHLFVFARYVEQFRGWGRALRRAVGDWYLRDAGQVAFQAVKYRQREGWSHRDLLRLSHPVASTDEHKALFEWIARPTGDAVGTPSIVQAFQAAQCTTDVSRWVELVTDHRLPWEALPDAALGEAAVWEALLPHMGLTALIRNLARFSQLGIIAPLGGRTNDIVARLTDEAALLAARVHPLSVLSAAVTYGSGHGFRGTQTWTPVPKVVDALNEAFYLSFGAVEPAGKRTLVGLDVSGSMTVGTIANSPIAPFQAEAAMAMVAVRTEPEVFPMAFSGGFVNLPLTASQRLDDVLRLMSGMPFDRTDCAVPMQWAAQNKVPVDTFIVYTDNETWSGGVHPFQALRRYRDIMGIPAKMVVVGMTSTGFSIADPSDRGMLDVVGFDTATPNLISAFSRGDL